MMAVFRMKIGAINQVGFHKRTSDNNCTRGDMIYSGNVGQTGVV